MDLKYKLAGATIPREDLEELAAWLLTDPRLTQGALVQEFERKYAEWLGVRHAVFVNSGSSANLLMYYASMLAGLLPHKTVVVPAVSWSTSVAPAIQLGLQPIPCDAEPGTLALNPRALKDILRQRDVDAVVLVHVLGVPGLMKEILELKEEYGFTLLEDACAAMGSTYAGRHVGTFGGVSTFSFYYGHHLSTIEGGMVCTNSDYLHALLLHLRSHGWGVDAPRDVEEENFRYSQLPSFNRRFAFYYPGFNVRGTDLSAHIGISQLRRVDHVVRRRVENHRRYQERCAGAFTVQENAEASICSISFGALARDSAHRDRVAGALAEAQVETRPIGGGNMTRQPFWVSRYGVAAAPVADRVHNAGFQLPNHPDLSLQDVDAICDAVVKASAD